MRDFYLNWVIILPLWIAIESYGKIASESNSLCFKAPKIKDYMTICVRLLCGAKNYLAAILKFVFLRVKVVGDLGGFLPIVLSGSIVVACVCPSIRLSVDFTLSAR